MNKLISFTLFTLLSVVSLFATNGDNLIGLGTSSRAMGGTGIAHFSAGSSATGNPALITFSKGGEFTFGATYLSPSVNVRTNDTNGANDLSALSDAKKNTIPYAALTHNLDNGWSVGGSIFGAAGMGTDWTKGDGAISNPLIGDVGLYSMKSSLTMLKISAPVAYKWNDWSFGIAPVMVFGTLHMSFISPTIGLVDNNSSSNAGFGFELGSVYNYSPLGLSFGIVYHSPVSLSYKDQISSLSTAFGYGTQDSNFEIMSDTLEQPAEYGIGIDWTRGDLSVTADYRSILWGEAEGYKDFNWENQDVYSIGGEYRINELALRCGYNYGKNPIKVNNDTTVVSPASPATNGDVINTFNHVMFPAITETHYTIGVGYQFNNAVGGDLALTFATSPEVTVSAKSIGLGNVSVSNEQYSASAAINVVF